VDVHACMHCGAPLLDSATRCPQCQADLTGTIEPPYPRELRPQPVEAGGLERYEIPWFDIPLAVRLIRDPSDVSPLETESVVRKYAARSLLLSGVGFVLTLSPMAFFVGLLPAALGLLWSIMVWRVARLRRTRTRRWVAAAGFALGLFGCVNVVMTILLSAAAQSAAP